MLRIDFVCPGLLEGDGEKPSSWVRAWFPHPNGGNQLFQRAYTLINTDPEHGKFSLAFLIHDPAGPAALWAQQAKVGDELIIQRMGGEGYAPGEAKPRGYLFLGDATSWPAISSIVSSLPPDVPVDIIMEAHRDTDRELPFPSRPQINVTWVPSRADDRALVNALDNHNYRGWHTWVAAEMKATRLVRSNLRDLHDQNRATMHAQAYWVRGRAMGKKLDVPTEEKASSESRVTTPDPRLSTSSKSHGASSSLRDPH
ncbi:siderophore-interacting protein [Corynebacterium parakroppenstedtii]|uniref:siderophore-interacting protein n=1 Tax=Corynebacterium parakroppenstedtii TaxID=2828363 RepID=UPI001C8F35E1|nr:SIP domain-containing protein [Corynebacterium parakroppenstedtii]MBY0794745.1 SIP domain-containing protein [Corynebacterium parakroppenstedtii]